jgi:hypothetical protein
MRKAVFFCQGQQQVLKKCGVFNRFVKDLQQILARTDIGTQYSFLFADLIPSLKPELKACAGGAHHLKPVSEQSRKVRSFSNCTNSSRLSATRFPFTMLRKCDTIVLGYENRNWRASPLPLIQRESPRITNDEAIYTSESTSTSKSFLQVWTQQCSVTESKASWQESKWSEMKLCRHYNTKRRPLIAILCSHPVKILHEIKSD